MVKQALTTIIAALAATTLMAQAPAFPGAEGHGRYVTGGRGGQIIHVTNLNDKGPGSLRTAVSGNVKKIVVFDGGCHPFGGRSQDRGEHHHPRTDRTLSRYHVALLHRHA